MKPNTVAAMKGIILKARESIPFDHQAGDLCGEDCRGCSLKLLEYLDTELLTWQDKLEQGITPNLGEVDKLAKSCNKIYHVLEKNGVIGRIKCVQGQAG